MKKKKGLTAQDIRNAVDKMKKAELEDPMVELKNGDIIFLPDGNFLRWSDIKPRAIK